MCADDEDLEKKSAIAHHVQGYRSYSANDGFPFQT